jgi:hypothetical protein
LNRKQLAVTVEAMNLSKRYADELDRIWMHLDEALTAHAEPDRRGAVMDAMKRVEQLKKTIITAAVKLGRKGGNKTAERGPEYFKQIAAMRKTKGGGRPRKQAN